MSHCAWARRLGPRCVGLGWVLRGKWDGSRVGCTSGVGQRRDVSVAAPHPSASEPTYKRMKPVEHVLLRPGMYVGSVSPAEDVLWCYDAKVGRMVQKTATVVPALFKIIDEVLVNAADNHHRSSETQKIDVAVDVQQGRITIRNDGPGIPVDFAKGESDLRTPELVFGHLLTGSNFDDSKKRYTGGRHGYGAKLANIFSTEFKLETHDFKEAVRYTQTWRKNMSEVERPVLEPLATKGSGRRGAHVVEDVPYTTTISFVPELSRFGMEELDSEVVSAIRKRTYDLAGSLGGRVKLSWQGEPLDDCKGFREWAGLFEPKVSTSKKAKDAKGDGKSGASAEGVGAVEADVVPQDAYPGLVTTSDDTRKPSGRWSVGVSCSPSGSFSQVTLVNSIATTRGGSHVNHVSVQVCERLAEMIQQKNRDFAVRGADVKHHLRLYIACLIDNPEFDSQSKERLTSKVSDFGSTFTLTDDFARQILRKTGIEAAVLDSLRKMQILELESKRSLTKVTSSSDSNRLLSIPKLEDANNAGGPDGALCTLVITEGDSAKALAVAGLSVVGRDTYGVFPLKGKMLNVRDASHSLIVNNLEFSNLKTILGLKHGKDYSTPESRAALRYGRIILMTDQDPDGSHIKGLFINMLHQYWPSLLSSGFVSEFHTPLVKAFPSKRKGSTTPPINFFSLAEYDAWRNALPDGEFRSWRIKYYKGLGTSTAEEGREYFANMARHLSTFEYTGTQDDDRIDLAFAKSRSDERKDWILNRMAQSEERIDAEEVAPQSRPGQDVGTLADGGHVRSYSEFVDEDLVDFSHESALRAIPSLMDGLKPSQRKVLYACFKRDLKKEVKVAQLAGYVAEHTAYHHGEESLMGTIIGMAQGFVGSNNLAFLTPNGQFGTRAEGGKDAASPRYVFTQLAGVTEKLFPPSDAPLLPRRADEEEEGGAGGQLEPRWFAPIIPTVLVNGGRGIGTGWSCTVPNYHPLDVVNAVEKWVKGEASSEGGGETAKLPALVPWYRGFTGSMVVPEKAAYLGKYFSVGRVQRKERGGKSSSRGTVLRIEELPVGVWTMDYREKLTKMVEAKEIRGFKEYHTEDRVAFELSCHPSHLESLKRAAAKAEASNPLLPGLAVALKLTSAVSTNNMFMFDPAGKITRYRSAHEIIRAFCEERHRLYRARHSYLLASLHADQKRLDNRARFIRAVSSGEVRIAGVPRPELDSLLRGRGFATDRELRVQHPEGAREVEEDGEEGEEEGVKGEYDYLLNMPLGQLTAERAATLEASLAKATAQHDELANTQPLDLWRADLSSLKAALKSYPPKQDDNGPALTFEDLPNARRRQPRKRTQDDDD